MVEVAELARGSRRRAAGPRGEERELLADRVYLALKEHVLDDVLAPGARLNIDALAAQFGVSPTPVREALARLAAENLVDTRSYRGYFVKERLTPAGLADLFEVRKLLEVSAVEWAAGRPQMTQLVEMERLLYEMGGPDLQPQFHEFRQFSILDQRFHEQIVGLAGSPALLASWQALNVHVQASRFFRTSGLVDVQHSVAEHAAILGALVAGETKAAVQAVADHIDAGLRRSLSGDPEGSGALGVGEPELARNEGLHVT